MDRRTDQTMLPLEAFGESFVAEAFGNQIFVRCTFACEDGTAGVDERKYDWSVEPFVLGLHMIDNAIMFYVGVESSNHKLTGLCALEITCKLKSMRPRKPAQTRVFLNGNTSIFSRSISIFLAGKVA